jgi:hypothetical protein
MRGRGTMSMTSICGAGIRQAAAGGPAASVQAWCPRYDSIAFSSTSQTKPALDARNMVDQSHSSACG